MSEVNPLAAAILPSAQGQRQQSAERANQIRRAQDVQRNAAHTMDTFVHQVESSEEITPVHPDDSRPEQHKKRARRRKPAAQSGDHKDEPGLDLTA